MSEWLDRLKDLLRKSELIRYLIIGILTTLVNIGITLVGNWYFGLEYLHITNKVAYISAILFAYVTNRIYVFRSRGKILPELIRFSAARLLISFIFEDLGLYLLYDLIGFKKMMPILKHVPWAKFVGMIGVVIANYIVGKFLVFATKKREIDEVS
ncbi:MAG TPA: GtrA family protein [Clostridiaceae bacterium]|nr:GtrA family protein [Clostridiaceae bacterium]